MPKKIVNKKEEKEKKRIYVTFTPESYKEIENIAGARGISMSAVVREWADQGLDGTLTTNNISFILPLIREAVDSVLNPKMERQIALTAKTCIQASAAAYLNAEVIANFLPDELQQDFNDAYRKARKKAVEYTRVHPESDIDTTEGD